MKIKCTIGGKECEFELTRRKLYHAFRELDMEYHKEDIMHFYFNDRSEDDLMKEWGVSREEFDSRMSDMVLELQKEISDAKSDYLYECIQTAVDRVMARYE